MAIDFGKDLIVRWQDGQAAHVRLLQQIGVQGVLTRQPVDPGFEKACQAAGVAEAELQVVKVEERKASPGTHVALDTGLWPGISRGASGGRDDDTTSASREPWVDANGFWIAYLRAMYPHSAPVLAYEATEKSSGLKADRMVPYDSLTLALVEARAMGGNYILSVEPNYRKALLRDEPRAIEAWKQLGAAAKWCNEHRALFAAEPMPTITQLVEPGHETPEFANLMYRRNASPRLTATIPAPAKDVLTVVTTGMRGVSPRVLDHARQGAVVVTDDASEKAWWRVPGLKQVKEQEDRIFYALGKGTVVAYKDAVADPSEHALDVIDFVTHPNRAIRIWNAPSVIAVASKNVARLLNYGNSAVRGPGGGGGRGNEIQTRLQGVYRKATLLRPGYPPAELPAARRGTTTEVYVPAFERVAAVVFE
jgi:hypothetical protein